MSHDVIQQLEELPIEDISSPITAHILGFCDVDDGASTGIDLFQPSGHSQQQHHLLLSSSDVSSSSPTTTAATRSSPFCCYADVDGSFSPYPSLDAAALSAILDAPPPSPPAGPEPGLLQSVGYDCSSSSTTSSAAVATPIATSSNLTPQAMLPILSSTFQDPFEHIMLAGVMAGGYTSYSGDQVVPAAMGGASSNQYYQRQQVPATPVYEEDPRYADASAFVQQMPGFMGLEAAAPPLPCGFFEGGDGGGMQDGGFYHSSGGIGEAHGFFGGEMMAAGVGGPAIDVGEYRNGGLGIYGRCNPMQDSYNTGDLQQVIGGNGQQLMTGSSSSSTTLAVTDTSTVDESSFKVGRLSVEERKEKIHRYMKKRNERNFSKKIKYACRKTLADSRPRVRGRFAKNDEFGEASRATSSNHEYDDEEEGTVKEGEDMLESSDILAHISGVNSFRYNFSLESWV